MKAMRLENDSEFCFCQTGIHYQNPLEPKKISPRPMAFACEQGPLPRLKESQEDHHSTSIKASGPSRPTVDRSIFQENQPTWLDLYLPFQNKISRHIYASTVSPPTSGCILSIYLETSRTDIALSVKLMETRNVNSLIKHRTQNQTL